MNQEGIISQMATLKAQTIEPYLKWYLYSYNKYDFNTFLL